MPIEVHQKECHELVIGLDREIEMKSKEDFSKQFCNPDYGRFVTIDVRLTSQRDRIDNSPNPTPIFIRNDSAMTIEETKELIKALKKAIKFVEDNPK